MPQATVDQTSPNLAQQANVELVLNDFEASVWNKGYEVVHEKALRCPCKQKGGDNRSACKNCLGSGWLFINRTKTRMVSQSMNLRKNFKDWSEEDMGNISITAIARDKLGYMDRITLLDATTYFSQIIYPVYNGIKDTFTARCIYEPIAVEDAFLFDGTDNGLKRLAQGTDFTVASNVLTFSAEIRQKYSNAAVSVRYSHNPAFHVIDMTREAIASRTTANETGVTSVSQFPIHAIARRAHYIFDSANVYGNDGNQNELIDNSYTTDVCTD